MRVAQRRARNGRAIAGTARRRAGAERRKAAPKLPAAPVANGKWWEQVGPAFNNDPVFEEMLAYGRYFRKTGQEPPPDWKPGDPIPEPAAEDEVP